MTENQTSTKYQRSELGPFDARAQQQKLIYGYKEHPPHLWRANQGRSNKVKLCYNFQPTSFSQISKRTLMTASTKVAMVL